MWRIVNRLAVAASILFLTDATLLLAAQSPSGSIITVPATPREYRATADRFDRLDRWIRATASHRLGESDAFSQELATWSLTDLQALWVDAHTLAQLMRDRSQGNFSVRTADGQVVRIVYSRRQLDTLLGFACIAGGYLDPAGFTDRAGSVARECVVSAPLTHLDPEMAKIALWFGSERLRRGDDNLFWRRSAVLHSDVAMLEQPRPLAVGTTSLPIGPRRLRAELLDGRQLAITLGGVHWSLAETVLEFVRARGATGETRASTTEPPSDDPMVRSWYQATTMWLQRHEQRDLQHLDAGLARFPDDGLLLFLRGCEHESYGSPAIQVPLEGARRSDGPVRSSRDEWRTAASDFIKSLETNGPRDETLLHLGRVQTLLGSKDAAVRTLASTYDRLPSASLRYLRDMFLGEALEQTAAFEDANAAFARAHNLFPTAQSPMLALSQLQRRMDHYDSAKTSIATLWTSPTGTDDDDPWWLYSVSHTAGADARVEAVWRSVE